jgi:urease accessory protein
LAWTSPAFPVGSYAYSHGIEYAIEAGLIGGADDLGRWVGEIVARGAGFADAVFLAHTWRATRSGDEAALAAVGERASAYRGSAEAALESEAQGRAFVAAVGAGWPQLRPAEGTRPIPPYAVAVGASAARGGIDIEDAVAAFLRLIPLGQGEGVRVLAALAPTIGVVAAKALVTGLDDLGTATVRVDWTMARHETQHVRLFRS